MVKGLICFIELRWQSIFSDDSFAGLVSLDQLILNHNHIQVAIGLTTVNPDRLILNHGKERLITVSLDQLTLNHSYRFTYYHREPPHLA
jgi:hypothetical protein